MSKVTTHNQDLKKWIGKMAEMCQPDSIVWIDGSEEEKLRLEKEAVAAGELIPLNEKELPGCFLPCSVR